MLHKYNLISFSRGEKNEEMDLEGVIKYSKGFHLFFRRSQVLRTLTGRSFPK